MDDHCTIFGKIKDLDKLESMIKSYSPSSSLKSAGARSSEAKVRGNAGDLRLNFLWYGEGGDKFSHLCLGMLTYIEGLPTDDPAITTRSVSYVLDCKLAIGVVAEPSFDSDDRYEEIILSIAALADGIIFNGSDILDREGTVLLAAP